ncbi:peptide deformylase 1A, chloroplastic-like [Neltuma alba]|uniref:peptide deformylase 1A, chloroplastic-like n=1 Tax=Neltuma alba TaxID=207710 RepID=UPI0010A5668D|nr:peptide deformylase 1A, chloroplastic-like [Prosopis alba]XP_028779155.1 peptide deformylase 1A, chloroplastic-like [Prosopis alba]XP_028779395.1 peptide deformylase 1A, chloroplastic-like [Prosopis alba]
MEALHRLSFRFLSVPLAERCLLTASTTPTLSPARVSLFKAGNSLFYGNPTTSKSFNSASPRRVAKAGWFVGLGADKKLSLPDIVKAGDPVLHEPAQEVNPDEISSERIQKIIDDMIKVMRKAPGVGLAAPQIGIPLRIIVLEDTTEYISYAPKEEIKAQDRRPFDLLVILNPKLEKRSNRTALFFEGCLSVDGFRAAVERYLDVEVTGLDRNGKLIKINASGWQARILQHECDHLDGTLYVDKMVPKTFRTVENLDLPLAQGCPKLGPR